MHLDEHHVAGLAVALGAGLLIGTKRERHKGQAADREAAGLRSFKVAAMSGENAQALPSAGLTGADRAALIPAGPIGWLNGIAPTAAAALAPAALAGAVGAGAADLMALHGTKTQAPIALAGRSALRLAVGSPWRLPARGSRHRCRLRPAVLGDLGLKVCVALAAIGDAQAPVASLSSLHTAGPLADDEFVRGALLAVSINSVTLSVAAAWTTVWSIGR